MGRTVKSFRVAMGEEEMRWERVGRRLTTTQQGSLREALRSARLYASAASMSVRATVFEAFFMAMLLDACRERRGRE